MSRRISLAALCLSLLSATGCPPAEPIPIAAPSEEKDYDRPLPPGQLALRKITDPAMIPDFTEAYQNAQNPDLRAAIERSLHYLSKKSTQRYFPYGDVSHDRAVASLRAFLDVLSQARSPQEFNQIIRERFDVYISVGCDNKGTVLYTGYYTPIFDGRMTRTAGFEYPIYKLPRGFQKDVEGNPTGGPWKSRQEIESGNALAGQELVWLADRFQTYVVTVQGSGQIRMPDGRIFEIGYAGNNGHEYKSVARELVADGKIEKSKMSLQAMLDYFKAHPDEIDTYCWRNPRYVFFQPAPGGPYGCLNEKVATLCSIATDKEIFPRACLAFLDTALPPQSGGTSETYKGFACDQDRGAAIRAAGRCDVFMGVGDAAGRRAGFTYNEGKLYYLFLKEGGGPRGPGGPDVATHGGAPGANEPPPAASTAPPGTGGPAGTAIPAPHGEAPTAPTERPHGE
ncbi:MAG: MltA domain-containing protein [Phycisphaerae bacterium]